MNKTSLLAVAAVLMSAACCAEEEETSDEAMPVVQAPAAKPKFFTALPLCRRVEGRGFVRKPGGEWAAVEEGRFYPFGSSYRADKDSIMSVAFGPDVTVTISDGAEFCTLCQEVGVASRSIVLVSGTVSVKLPENLPEGSFFMSAFGFTVKNPAGESRLTVVDKGDGDEVVVRCVTGSLGISGRHFEVPVMRAANEIKIRTTRDHLTTILNGTSGDYIVKLDQGKRYNRDVDDDGNEKMTIDETVLDWRLSPFTKVIINRSVPAIGERMSVHTMAFDASGERKSECCFCECRAEVNSGELVMKKPIESEEIDKKASEVDETKPKEETEKDEEAETSEE